MLDQYTERHSFSKMKPTRKIGMMGIAAVVVLGGNAYPKKKIDKVGKSDPKKESKWHFHKENHKVTFCENCVYCNKKGSK